MQGNNQTGNSQNQKPGGSGASSGGSTPPNQSGLSWTQPARPSTQPASSAPVTKPIVVSPPVSTQSKPAQTRSTASAKQSDATSSSRTLSYFVGGIIIAVLLVWGIYALRSNGGANIAGNNATSTATSTTKTATSSSPKVSNITTTKQPVATKTTINIPASTQFNAGDQKAGTVVVVSNVRVQAPAWLVIYDSVNGKPGNALGAAMAFPEHNGTSVTVSLLRATIAGRTYLVGETIDNGDHVFSTQSDQKVLDTQGNLIVTTFKAQ